MAALKNEGVGVLSDTDVLISMQRLPSFLSEVFRLVRGLGAGHTGELQDEKLNESQG